MSGLHALRDSQVRRLVLATSISSVGNWLNTVAVALLAYHLTRHAGIVGVTLAASVAPRLIIGLLAGAIADRYPPRTLAVGLNVAMTALALVPLAARTPDTVWLLVATNLALQAAQCLYTPALAALRGPALRDDLREEATALMSVTMELALVAGPALATALVVLWGTQICFVLNGASFALAALLLYRMPGYADGARGAASLAALVAGYGVVARKHPRVMALCLWNACAAFAVFFLQGVSVSYATAIGQPSSFVGLIYTAAGVGGALGAGLMVMAQRRLSFRASVAIMAGQAPFICLLGAVRAAPEVLACIALSTLCGVVTELVVSVMVQRTAPPDEQGRLFGLFLWFIYVGQIAGAALASVVTPRTVIASFSLLDVTLLPLVVLGVILALRTAAPRAVAVAGAGAA